MIHLLDPIHIIKNVASSLYPDMTNKDSDKPNVRKDLKDTNTKCSSWITHN